ncbi:MAG: polysaccharide lyase family 7 protein [Reichenbachiella sp.]
MKGKAFWFIDYSRESRKIHSHRLVQLIFLQFTIVFGALAQNPDLPPSGNFDLSDWKVTLPDQVEIKEKELSAGFERANEFYTDPVTGAMVFRCPNNGATGGSTYPRSELREMLRAGNTGIGTTGFGLNNWVFSSSSQSNQDISGGIDGKLTATVTVDHVSTSGTSSKVGRVIIGQIHASDDEPCRLYYRKLPDNSKGSIYIAHEPTTSSEQWYDMIGSRSSNASNPSDGIELGERFSYEIKVEGNTLTVTIMRPGKPDVQQIVDMTNSGFADDWMYFKAGVYNQNNTGNEDDYCQVSFYALSNSHSTANNSAPTSDMTAPADGSIFDVGDNITITADATDSDGTISKVEFFAGPDKLGEDTSAPYSFVWENVPVGNFGLSTTATDNEGAATSSSSFIISVKPSYDAPYDIPKFQDFLGECKLQAPTSVTLATQAQIIDGYTDNNFYVVDWDKMAFNQSGTSQRTELRALTNWSLSEGDRSLHTRISIEAQTCEQVTVIQIHDDANEGDGPNKPLLRVYKHLTKSPENHLWAAIKSDDGGVNTTHVDLGLAPEGYFNCDVRIVNGYMIIELDGEEKANMDISYWTFPSYWKAGVYLQDEGEATAYFDKLYTGDGGNKPPSISITAPGNNSVFEDGDNITITADASDVDGSIAKVEFFRGTTKLGEDNSSPYSYLWNNVSEGSYTLTTTATDNEGATTTSEEIDITINPVPEQYTLTSDITGDGTVTLNPAGGVYDDGTEVTLTAEANDGSLFDNWSGDASGTSNVTTVIMNADKSVTAEFSEEVLSIETATKEDSGLTAYPNPFSGTTTFHYELSSPANVELSIYNFLGQRIDRLIKASQNSGIQNIVWHPANDLRSGIYLAKIQIGHKTSTFRIVLNR